ncbi:MAG TPA: hypothetical protein DIT19_02210 [Desulfonauticus sp.]|nr:hypothetical protein [Desulfonauticus sp.]
MAEIKDKVKNLFLVKKENLSGKKPSKDFDLVEMPLEGVVVYWLSLSKLFKKRGFLEQEIKSTTEPYINYLLRLLSSNLSPNTCIELAKIKGETILEDLQKKLVLMSISVLGMSIKENPQKVMIRFISKFPISSIYEQKILSSAREVVDNLEKPDFPKEKFLNIDHRFLPEKLMLNLMVYNFLERRVEHTKLMDYLQYVRSFYFAEGVSLIVDGFDYDFVKHRLNLQKREIIYHTRAKMEVSGRLVAGLKTGLSYQDLSLIAQAYL